MGDGDARLGTSERLWLVRAPDEVLRARPEGEIARVPLRVGGRSEELQFPPTWPGEARPIVENWLRLRHGGGRGEPWGGALVERATRRAVGTIGCKEWPDAEGTVEVGYGVEPSRRGRGLAKEGLACLLALLRAQDGVRRVIAETHEANVASQRVLRACGFDPFGAAATDEGRMIWWERGLEGRGDAGRGG